MTVPAGPVRDHATGPRFFIGLMSGTSADGIDAALVRFDETDGAPHGALQLGRTYPWEPVLRERLVAVGQGARIDSLDEVGTLDVRIAEALADAATRLLAEAGLATSAITAIGSHGQTVRHRPDGAAFDGRHPFTLQLGDGNVIADNESGRTLREVYPNRYPKDTVAQAKTREQVKAELAEAQRTGDIIADGESGKKLNELYPSRYPKN